MFKKPQIKYNIVHVDEGKWRLDWPDGKPKKISKKQRRKIINDIEFAFQIEAIMGHSPEWIQKMKERAETTQAFFDACIKIYQARSPFADGR